MALFQCIFRSSVDQSGEKAGVCVGLDGVSFEFRDIVPVVVR